MANNEEQNRESRWEEGVQGDDRTEALPQIPADRNQEDQNVKAARKRAQNQKPAPQTTSGIVLLPRHFLWFGLLVLTMFMRFHHLGEKPFHHDESLYSKYYWNFYTGLGYEYDPMQHGPFQFTFAQLILFLFGVTNYTVRIMFAFFGTLTVMLAYGFRHRFGERGSFILGLLMAVSPTLVYYHRMVREDAIFAFFTVLFTLGISLWLHTKAHKYLYLAAAAFTILICIKESFIVPMFTVVSFFVLKIVYDVGRAYMKNQNYKEAFIGSVTEYPIVTKISILMTTWAAILAGFALMFITMHATYQGNWNVLVRTYWVLGILLLTAMIVGCHFMRIYARTHGVNGKPLYRGFFEDSKELFWVSIVFLAIYLPLYTTFFTHMKALWTAIYGWFEYWLNQHQIKRIAGPFHYYNWKLINYEGLATLLALFYGLLKLSVRRSFVIGIVVFMAIMLLIGNSGIPGINHEYFTGRHLVFAIGFFIAGAWSLFQHFEEKKPFLGYCIHWAVTSYLLYSYLQEKVPWLTVHIAIPVTFVGAYVLDQMLDYKRSRFWRYAGFAFIFVFGAYEIHSTFLMNWYHESDPTEQLVYVQTTPDMPRLVKEIEQIAEMRGEGKNMPLVYGGEATWPLYWYLRDWNKVLYAPNLKEVKDIPVIVADWKKRFEYIRQLGDDYVVRRYRIRHWWIPSRDDFQVDWGADIQLLWARLTSAQTDKKEYTSLRGARWLWRWIIYRETFRNEIYGSEDCAVFFHKDAADRLWKVDVGTAPPEEAAAESRPAEPTVKSEVYPPVQAFGAFGDRNGAFKNPGAIAVDTEGNMYVADTDNNRIQKFSPDGSHLMTIGKPGDKDGEFKTPRGVAVDKNGFIYVSDTWNHRIQKFNNKGEFVVSWGSGEQYWAPKAIAVNDKNEVFIIDTGYHRVHKTDGMGKELKLFGKMGSMHEEFHEPVGIAIDGDGNILVADTANFRIQIFSPDGRFIRAFPVFGWENYYSEPYLAVAPDGRIFTTDSNNNRIQIYSKEGKFLGFWGVQGTNKGQFTAPLGIAIKGDRVYVTEGKNNRVQVFALPQSTSASQSQAQPQVRNNSQEQAQPQAPVDPQAQAQPQVPVDPQAQAQPQAPVDPQEQPQIPVDPQAQPHIQMPAEQPQQSAPAQPDSQPQSNAVAPE